MANLSIKNVDKIYAGNVKAVNNFNLEVKHGEFIVLVGPSGCGKSTMLRMIAGLESISNGKIWIGDKMVNNTAPADRNIAMVFQNYALLGNLSVYENMGFPLKIRKYNGDFIHDRVMKAADTVELKELLNRRPQQLSGGQKQRVALGRSIVRSPSIFLMDEPLSNLDAKLRKQTRIELLRLHQKLNGTFIYVTHDQLEAMTMATRIVVMNNGVIQQVGTPHQIYHHPCNIFVASFIGSPSMNFFRGRIKEGCFVNHQLRLGLTGAASRLLQSYHNEEVIMGVRPENIKVNSDEDNSFRCQIDIAEYLGAEYSITFTFGDDQSYNVIVDASGIHCLENDCIHLSIDMNKAHFFDPKSKERITEVKV
ncbi:MAG: sn-glycerol-3-phosphate ABC transporter ATP-binding protein UgpC [Spirochaetes bacterium]|nr:sn-glycerol-3-phosphate ABC transporter ATP-binding protein UgpC [Spirochaetota bacterium]